MFDELDRLGDAGLLTVMRDAQRAERAAIARRLLAAGRLCQRRLADRADERGNWCVDDWEAIAAEVGAELGISRGRASSQLHYGTALWERLPILAGVFAAGALDFGVLAAIVYRTALITDPAVLAGIDQVLADRAPGWNTLSRVRIAELVDWLVIDADPDAVRVARQAEVDREIVVEPDRAGMAEIWGSVRAPDAALFDRRLEALAGTVCRDDPRTQCQRRADALGALAAGAPRLGCACGSADCPAAGAVEESSPGAIVLHVLAEAATVAGTSTTPGLLPGYGALPAAAVQQLATRARIRPLTLTRDWPAEPRYRPSAALAEVVRCRDLTCRWPGCDCPAEHCDIDHTVPYPLGPTHPSNLKLYCRVHHLLKTFYTGSGGWSERQLPDGTLILTSPSGRTYTTTPGGALFFPQLALPTGQLALPSATAPPPDDHRTLMMPTRKRTRAQDRAYRVQWERTINHARYAADPPPF